jgi:hypothetical protein
LWLQKVSEYRADDAEGCCEDHKDWEMINGIFHGLMALGFLIIIGCGRQESVKEVIEYFPNGEIRSVKEVDDKGKKNGWHKIYYPNGQLQHKVQYRSDTIHGLKFQYYEDGTLMSQFEFYHGICNGRFKKYFANGKLQESGYLIGENLRGEFIRYYEHSDSLIMSREFLTNFGDILVLQAYERYDTTGKIIESLPLPYSINFPQGILQIGKTYPIEIHLERQKYDSARLLIGGFEWDFNFDPITLDTVFSSSKQFSFSFTPERVGKNIFRAIIEDYRVIDDSTNVINNKFIEVEYQANK